MNKKKLTGKPFLEKVATFDFDKYYTIKIRFVFHILMWLVFSFLLQFNLFFDSNLPVNQAFAFATRSMVCNMAVFYLFFYFIVPQTILKNRVIPTIFSLLFCLIFWMVLNHYLLVFIGKHFKVDAPYYKEGIESNLHERFTYLVSPKNLLVEFVPFFNNISPYFFIKILFDIIRFYSKWFKSEKKAAKLEFEKLNLEKDFLKSQLNPHFLFNTLNNLYGLALRLDKKTPQVITQLSEMMRYTLYESNENLVPISKEVEYLKNYILLEKMRYRNNRDIVLTIDDTQIGGQMIAPLLTFTFVENGFKYGLKSKNEGFLKINISVLNHIFYFSIQNDKEEKYEKKGFGGIGHRNVRKRLQLLYPGKHDLKIEDRGKTFYVAMMINLQ